MIAVIASAALRNRTEMDGAAMLIIGNWKMHGDRRRLDELAKIDRHVGRSARSRVALCLPATLIAAARERARYVAIGAQDCHDCEHGAFTGKIAATMLAEVGAELVIIGHSECRAAGDNDSVVRAKIEAAVRARLRPILCVGETMAQRAAGDAEACVNAQVEAALPLLPPEALAIAYEPVWAIGSGQTPSADEIVTMIAGLRAGLAGRIGVMAERVPILYGGSVTAANANELLALPELGGLLVGRASLTAESFIPILAAAA